MGKFPPLCCRHDRQRAAAEWAEWAEWGTWTPDGLNAGRMTPDAGRMSHESDAWDAGRMTHEP